MWMRNDAATMTHPHPPSGGSGSESSSLLSKSALVFCFVGAPWAMIAAMNCGQFLCLFFIHLTLQQLTDERVREKCNWELTCMYVLSTFQWKFWINQLFATIRLLYCSGQLLPCIIKSIHFYFCDSLLVCIILIVYSLSNEKTRWTERTVTVIAEQWNIWIVKLCCWRWTPFRIRTSDEMNRMLCISHGKNFPSSTKDESW